ncbi:MAG: L,D-transpeptidase [Clostridia bacterium]|nr:L,D-transpeptidase [Clostridia bacterium]
MKKDIAKKLFILLVLPLIAMALGTACGEAPHHAASTSAVTQTPIASQSSDMPAFASTPTTAPTTTAAPAPTQQPVKNTPAPTAGTQTQRKRYHIEVSLAAQIVYVYEINQDGSKGDLAKAMLCSTGLLGGNETPIRKWVILDNGMEYQAVRDARGLSRYKFEWLDGISAGQYMSRMWKVETDAVTGEEYFASSGYLFHSVPYKKIDRNALKTEEWNKLGKPASNGCIRMTVADAKWIYDHVAAYSYVYTIEGTPDPELWAALKLPDLPLDVTRDPTDVF